MVKVYVTANAKKSKVFHTTNKCTKLNCAKSVNMISLDQAKSLGYASCDCKEQAQERSRHVEIDWDRCITNPFETSANPWKPAGANIEDGVYVDDRPCREPICDIYGRVIWQGENLFDEAEVLAWQIFGEEEYVPVWDANAEECWLTENVDFISEQVLGIDDPDELTLSFEALFEEMDEIEAMGARESRTFALKNSDWGRRFSRCVRRCGKPPEQKPKYKFRNKKTIRMGGAAMMIEQAVNEKAAQTIFHPLSLLLMFTKVAKEEETEAFPLESSSLDIDTIVEQTGTEGKARAFMSAMR